MKYNAESCAVELDARELCLTALRCGLFENTASLIPLDFSCSRAHTI